MKYERRRSKMDLGAKIFGAVCVGVAGLFSIGMLVYVVYDWIKHRRDK